jgi:hypothetical protein
MQASEMVQMDRESAAQTTGHKHTHTHIVQPDELLVAPGS